MPKSSRPRPPSVGFRYAPPPPAPREHAGTDGVSVEVARWVRQRRELDMVRQMEGGSAASASGVPGAVGGPPQVMPGPASITEAVNAASGISQIHREAAQTALEQAEQERLRRQEAEESVGSAAEAARKDEANRWQAITDMTNTLRAEITSIREESHQAQLAAKESEAARIAAQMKADADRITAALTAERDRLAAELEREKARVAQLAQRPTVQDMMVRAMQNPSDPDLAVFRQVYGTHQGESFEEWWRKEQAKRMLNSQDAEERRREENHRAGLRLKRHLSDGLAEARGHLGRLAGPARGIDRHGVSADFDDPQPRAGEAGA